MRLIIDGRPFEAREGETLLEACRRSGAEIPTLCAAPGAKHVPSCMVCMVRDTRTDQMIPSCGVAAAEGMSVDTASTEVRELRRMALELLLSDHRADCDAPCAQACPQGLDICRVLEAYDRGDLAGARRLLAAVFSLPALPCGDCKAPCERVCRRGQVDRAVSIQEIFAELAALDLPAEPADPAGAYHKDPARFNARIGTFSPAERERLQREVRTRSRCLHCACDAAADCRLRELASAHGIRSSRFGLDSTLPFKAARRVTGRLWFDPAKCVRCGLCVYNSRDGFTFRERGFEMQVVLPEGSEAHVSEELASLCPTGALTLRDE